MGKILLHKIDSIIMNTTTSIKKLSNVPFKAVEKYSMKTVAWKYISVFIMEKNHSYVLIAISDLFLLAIKEIMKEDIQMNDRINAIFVKKAIIEGTCWRNIIRNIIQNLSRDKLLSVFNYQRVIGWKICMEMCVKLSKMTNYRKKSMNLIMVKTIK